MNMGSWPMKRNVYNRSCLIVVVFLFFLPYGPCIAQELISPVALTLSEAVHIAVGQNPIINAARHQVDANASKVQQANAWLYPQVDFTETFNRTNNPMWAFGTKLNQEAISQNDFDPDKLNDPDGINNFASAVSVQWPVYRGGQTRISIKQAKENRDAVSLELERTRQEVIAQTAVAYVGLLLANKNVAVVTQALETAKAHLKLVRSRFESGFVVKSDLLRAQVRIAELEQVRLQSESHVNVATAMLNAAMGEPIDQTIDPATPLENCRNMEESLEQWVSKALSNRPDLNRLQYQENIAQHEVAKTKAGHMPNLNLVGAYEINSEDFGDTADNYTLGAVMRINLFSGHGITSRTAETLASLRRIQSIKKAMDLGVRVETKKAFLEAQSAWERISVSQTAVSLAEEGLRIVNNRYKNGLLTMVSLLDSEVALQEARTRHFKAMHDYKIAKIKLAMAAGTIDVNLSEK
jgi:outer membrane protein